MATATVSETNAVPSVPPEAVRDDPAFCFENRKSLRAMFTRIGTKISSIIGSRGSRSALHLYQNDLKEIYDECLSWHHRYLAASKPTVKAKVKGEEWEKVLTDAFSAHCHHIDTYFALRADDASSVASFKSVSSVSSRTNLSISASEIDRFLHDAHHDIKNQQAAIDRRQKILELEEQRSMLDEQLRSLALEEPTNEAEDEAQSESANETIRPQGPGSASTPLPTNAPKPAGTFLRASAAASRTFTTTTSSAPGTTSVLDPSASVFRPTIDTIGSPPRQSTVRFTVPPAAPTITPRTNLQSTTLMLDHDVSYFPLPRTSAETRLVWSHPTPTAPSGTSMGPLSYGPGPTHSAGAHFSSSSASVPAVPNARADSWILTAGDTHTPISTVPARTPRLTVPTFNGDPKSWLNFAASFHTAVHRVTNDNAYRLTMLRDALSPTVQRSVGQYLLNPALYQAALTELQRTYGEPHLIAAAHLDELESLPGVPENDPAALQRFVANVNGAVAALCCEGFDHALKHPKTLSQLVKKLPLRLRTNWGNELIRLQDMGVIPSVQHFINCIKTVARVEREIADSTILPPHDIPGLVKNTQPSQGSSRSPGKPSKASPKPSSAIYAVETTTTRSATDDCLACSAKHDSASCKVYLDLPLDDKIERIKDLRACYRCLGRRHLSAKCPRVERCGVDGCSKAHHSSIHGVGRIYPDSSPAPAPPAASLATEIESDSFAVLTKPTSKAFPVVALNVVPVVVEANERSIRTYALLDSGSSKTIIHDSIRQSLGIDGPVGACKVKTINGESNVPCRTVTVSISPTDRSSKFSIQHALVLEHPDMPRRQFNPSKLKQRWPHLADLTFDSRDTIQATILIGRDVDGAIDVIDRRRPPAGSDGPQAEKTAFGWSIVGPIAADAAPGEVGTAATLTTLTTDAAAIDLHRLVEKSFELDAMGILPKGSSLMPTDDRRGLATLKSRTQHTGERYKIGLMWKSIEVHLPDNYASAYRRLLALERKFERDPAMAARYAAVIEEYLRLGHARKVEASELPFPPGKYWLLSHLAVEQPTKTRVVFDASARHKGVCLNDVLLKGPDLLVNLLDLLTRFRLNLIPLSADIEKMYHQVQVEEDEQPFFAFLWRAPGSTAEPDVHVMTVHVFGAISSPATCMYALRRTAEDFRSQYPEVADLVSTNFYVDNYLDSVDAEETAITRQRQLTSLLQQGGFRLTKWSTSSRHVLSQIPSDHRSCPTTDLTFDDLPLEKILGLTWDRSGDIFKFVLKTPAPVHNKRELLRATSSIFDPLGMLAPVILKARIILKNVWASGIDWNEPLPDRAAAKWDKWAARLDNVHSLRIPRCLRTTSSPVTERSLHCFSDASTEGYGAALYLRSVHKTGEISVTFVMGKSRVAPLKFSTIHRLELQAALLGVRLSVSLLGALSLSTEDLTLWSDSQTTLKWINSKTMKFQVFVANRVADVLDLSSASQWRYVPTEANPADDASRGLYGSELSTTHRWFAGPEFLSGPTALWPVPPNIPEPDANEPEVAGPLSAFTFAVTEANTPVTSLLERISSWNRGLRTVALILRWIPRNRHLRSQPTVSVDELAAAEIAVIRLAQRESFPEDFRTLESTKDLPLRSPLTRLAPFLSSEGIVRVGGRLENSELPYASKHPIVLPKRHPVTRLIIWHRHLQLHHSSPSRTLSDLVQKFWIIHARTAVNDVYNNCPTCRRRTAPPMAPQMAPLPSNRVRAFDPPFAVTGIDYFGPLEVIVFRRRVKRYGVIFTCLNTRAVHLEVAASLNTESFLMAFRRFSNVRGRVSVCYSDNGTNLVSGEKELRQCLEEWNQQHITDRLAQDGVKWVFNPPAAPHFGGAWERLIRSAKSALRIVLRDRPVSDEVLATAMSEVASLLNGRPLTHISVDPADPEPLTPNHFLLLRPHPALPPTVIGPQETGCSRKQWRQALIIAEHFWRRWLREYLPFLTERRKWLNRTPNLQIGDVVLVVDSNSPRGHWPVARVLEVYPPDPNATIRAALVKTRSGTYVRPVAKLCLLETSGDRPESSDSKMSGIEGGNVPDSPANK